MATLSNEVKAFIVHGLATYQTSQELANRVNSKFGIGG